MSIAIIDYGAGNLRSVEKALEKLGFKCIVTSDPSEIASSKGIILPGVGAYDSAVKELASKDLVGLIKESALSGKPFLGLCLGMQLLFENSEEGEAEGFGVLKGSVKRFDPSKTSGGLKVPHMGWNNISIKKTSPIMHGISESSQVYFVHSYYCAPSDNGDILTTTDYGGEFVSSVSRGNMFALQFHPEKSGDTGLKMLKNFGGLCK